MARVKKGVNAHKRHKKILKLAKGFYGTKSKVFRAGISRPFCVQIFAWRFYAAKTLSQSFVLW